MQASRCSDVPGSAAKNSAFGDAIVAYVWKVLFKSVGCGEDGEEVRKYEAYEQILTRRR